jgi:YVTN family beta-propeller protein
MRFAHLLVLSFVTLTANAQMPSPALLVLNKSANELAIVDPQSLKVVGRVPTGEGPHEVTVSADGKYAFVGNYGGRQPGNTISIIDLAAQKARTVDVSPLRRPHGIEFHDGKVYFTAEQNKMIARLDPESGKLDWLLGTGQNATHMLRFSNDGQKIFTANIASDSISIIEHPQGSQDWTETAIQVGKGPEGFDVSPDARELWAANSRDGSVSIVDVGSKKVVQTLPLGTKRSNRLKFTPDGKLVLISDLDAGELLVIDAAQRKQIKRIPVGRATEGILIQPDGSRAFVATAGEDSVAIVDLKTLAITGRIPTGSGPDGMAWVK